MGCSGFSSFFFYPTIFMVAWKSGMNLSLACNYFIPPIRWIENIFPSRIPFKKMALKKTSVLEKCAFSAGPDPGKGQ
jgi:hypothetical protein